MVDACHIKHINPTSIRLALRKWSSLRSLSQHPLTRLNIVKIRKVAAGYNASEIGYGLALRDILADAIEHLKPDDCLPIPGEKSWRPYLILNDQYRKGNSPKWCMAQLHVARGTYFAEQRHAFEILSSILLEWEQSCPPSVNFSSLDRRPYLAPPRPAHTILGRQKLLSDIKRQLLGPSSSPVIALTGMTGVGKTTLAIELAHDAEIQRFYPDGILWVGLGKQPEILSGLCSWADALGISQNLITMSTAVKQHCQLIRSAIGLKHLLLIIDDVWQTEASQAFMIGGPNCAHLVTTQLAPVAMDVTADQVFIVKELDRETSLELLSQFCPQLQAACPATTDLILDAAGGLPLALVLTGRFLRRHSHGVQSRRFLQAMQALRQAEVRLQIAQPQAPLDTYPDLPVGKPISLNAILDISVSALRASTRQALYDLAKFPPKPNTFSEAAALAVAATTHHTLDTLVDHVLLECSPTDRYSMHQVVADYARLYGENSLAAPRLMNYIFTYIQEFTENFTALEMELANITAALEIAWEEGPSESFITAVIDLLPFLKTRGLCEMDEQLLGRALHIARIADDPGRIALILQLLGHLKMNRSAYKEALTDLHQSIQLAQVAGDAKVEARSLIDLGLACWYMGDPAGYEHLKRALDCYQGLGCQSEQALVHNSLGCVYELMGKYSEAIAHLKAGLQMTEQSHNPRAAGWAHLNMGSIYLSLGKFHEAREHWCQCRLIYDEIGDVQGAAWAIYHEGQLQYQFGCLSASSQAFSRALDTFIEIGDLMGQGFALHAQGVIHCNVGHLEQATQCLEQALCVFEKASIPWGKSQIYHTQGVIHHKKQNLTKAHSLLEQSLIMRQILNYPHGECQTLVELARVICDEGDCKAAHELAQRALELAQMLGTRPVEADSYCSQGHILTRMNELELAEVTYLNARQIRKELGQAHLVEQINAKLQQLRSPGN